MNIKAGLIFTLRLLLGAVYLWVVADRLGLLGPVGNPGVVWGDFESFLDYTATLNPWFPRQVSDFLGYGATFVELALAFLLIGGIRLRAAALASFGLLLVFAMSLVLAIGLREASGFIVFTIVAAGASLLIFREASRKAGSLAA
ncbi:MAG: DoxX family protein [bacterium]|nr:DoxX family protein [bacterium]